MELLTDYFSALNEAMLADISFYFLYCGLLTAVMVLYVYKQHRHWGEKRYDLLLFFVALLIVMFLLVHYGFRNYPGLIRVF